MNPILVVGATGQLGNEVVKLLAASGNRVRAMVRKDAAAARFHKAGIETVQADLTDAQSLVRACQGIACIVATANAALPSQKSDTLAAVDGLGYSNLIAAARSAGVRRIVYASALSASGSRQPLILKCKRETEKLIMASGLEYVILQAGIFMDVAFAMMGSSLPVRGAESASVLRPFEFSRNHFEKVRNSMEHQLVAQVAGDGTVRQAYVCAADVARCLAAAVGDGAPLGVHILNGPEALTPIEVVRIFERVLGCELRIKKTPAFVFRILSVTLRPFNAAAANLMHLNLIAATQESLPVPETPAAFGIELTTAKDFLLGKAAMSAASGT